MKRIFGHICILALLATPLSSCLNAEETFVGRRLQDLCDSAYFICSRPAGCVLESDRYLAGGFPGARRFVIVTEQNDVPVTVRLLFTKMDAPGTELLVQLYEPDCTIRSETGQMHMVDVDIFEEAGNDGILTFELEALEEGEHLIELYSDTSAEYVLVVETHEKYN